MKGVAQTSNIFHINRKKNNCRNDKVAPKAKIKTGINQAKIRRNKMFTSSDCINVSVMSIYIYISIFSRTTTSVSRAYCRLHSITHFPSGNI